MKQIVRNGAILLAIVAGFSWAGSPARAQAASGAAAGQLAPTNLPGVYAFSAPPAGFDPSAATAQELAQYGYPPRPDAPAGPEALAQWQRVTAPGIRRVVPMLVPTNRYHGPVAALEVDRLRGTEYSTNWSGYALTGRPGARGFYSVVGHWTVPTAQQAFGSCPGRWVYSSEWAGIDGYNNSDVLQSGSAADAYCDVPGQQISQYYTWFEWYPGPTYLIYQSLSPLKSFPFHAGDYLMAHVWATHWTNGVSRTGRVVLTDLTQNWQANLIFSAASVGGTEASGRSAEWIVERPQLGSKLTTLANYTADPWTLVYATDLDQFTGTPALPDGAARHQITMLDDAKSPISRVTLYGNSALWFFNEGSSR